MTVGMTFPDDATHELRELETHEVSLVDRPANKRPFLIVKSAGQGDTPGIRDGLVGAAKQLAALLSGDGEVSSDDAQKLGYELFALAGIQLAEAPEAPMNTPEVAVKTEPEVLAESAAPAESEVDEVEAILDDAIKTETPDSFDIVLMEATMNELRSELEQQVLDHGVEKTELEAKLAFQDEEHKAQVAELKKSLDDAAAQLETTTSNMEKFRIELDSIVAQKDAEIASLTSKLADAQKALEQAKKLSKAAPQAQRALSTLTHLAKGKKTAKPSQAIPEGETQTSGDPWDTGWSFN